jgi:hypothetical protein
MTNLENGKDLIKMTEFGYNESQLIQPGAGALLRTIRPCTRRPQLVMHEDESPLIYLRGAGCNPCSMADYEVKWSGNIALPAGGTPGEIRAALSLDGLIIPLTIAIATPAAVEQFWHVSGVKTVRIPIGCCQSVAVVNASVSADPATTPAAAIEMSNLNVTVNRTA